MGEDPYARGGSRRWIVREVENSLRRLRTDHIDLVRQGKVQYLGSSSYSGSQILEAQWAACERHLERFVTEHPATRSSCAASGRTSSPRSTSGAHEHTAAARGR